MADTCEIGGGGDRLFRVYAIHSNEHTKLDKNVNSSTAGDGENSAFAQINARARARGLVSSYEWASERICVFVRVEVSDIDFLLCARRKIYSLCKLEEVANDTTRTPITNARARAHFL